MSSFDEPTTVTTLPPAIAAIVGNPPMGTLYVPDSELTARQRNERALMHVLRRLETTVETLRAIICEHLNLEN